MFLEDESTLKPPKLFIGKKTRGKGAKCEGKKVKKNNALVCDSAFTRDSIFVYFF